MAGSVPALCLALLAGFLPGALGTVSRVCEHQTMSLSCSGKISISYANYGKLSYSYCNHGGNSNCRAGSSMSVVNSKCNGKSSCSVQASNGVFGDPCGGTVKYLEVHWSCLNVVNGNWGGWGGWTGCTKNCGSGTKYRTRSCNNPSPQNGGAGCSGSSSHTVSCNTHNCPRNGGWSGYGSWGSCTKSCGSGTQSRSRSCNNPSPAWGGSNCAGSSTSSQSCNTHNCPIHGGYTSWGSWGSCTKSCASGTKSRSRSCTNPTPQYGGNQCSGSAASSTSCNTHNCPIHGGYTSWGSWGSCTKSCASGTKSRSRSCTNPTPQYGGNQCSGSASSSTSCNTHNCPIHGAWAGWASWGSCTVTCGGGTQDRSRTCTNPSPQYGGANCPNSASSRQACNTHNCPIDGAWASWASWGSCTVTCGGGTQDRSRTCTNPSPQYGGANCPNSASSRQACNTHNCPIDGSWASWLTWGSCTLTCGSGTKDRSRTCTNPTPQYGGAACPNTANNRHSCNTHNCPIDGGLTPWSSWGTCTVTCGGGTQVKQRSCTSPPPQYGGAPCVGATSSNQDCNTQVCIIDGSWGAWTSWGTCTKTCGSGTYSRSRVCDNPPPANGGLPCPGSSSAFGDCNTAACPTVAAGAYQQLCPSGWFTCQSGGVTCIQDAFKCDCAYDCDDESDETETYASCPSGHASICALKASAGNILPTFTTVILGVITVLACMILGQ